MVREARLACSLIAMKPVHVFVCGVLFLAVSAGVLAIAIVVVIGE